MFLNSNKRILFYAASVLLLGGFCSAMGIQTADVASVYLTVVLGPLLLIESVIYLYKNMEKLSQLLLWLWGINIMSAIFFWGLVLINYKNEEGIRAIILLVISLFIYCYSQYKLHTSFNVSRKKILLVHLLFLSVILLLAFIYYFVNS